jgi:predicted permease
MLTVLPTDLRIAARSLARRPGFTAAALLTLAVGIGLNTTVFSLVYGVLLRELPYPDPDRVVALLERVDDGLNVASPPNFLDWRERNASFSAMGAFDTGRVNLTGGDEPERVSVAYLTGEVFAALNVAPALGRTLAAGDAVAGAAPVVVLGHEVWQRRFGGDRSILGRPVEFDGVARTVVGVMPPSFRFPIAGADAWLPLVFADNVETQRGAHWLTVVARLRPGVSLEAARVDMRRIGAQLAAEYPRHNAGTSVDVSLYAERSTGHLRTSFLLLWGAVGLVVLIASANLANLTLAAGAGRVRAAAVRAALGAGRARLVRQSLVESALLGALGGVVALPLAWAATRAMVVLLPADLPRLGDVRFDLPIALFGLALAVATGLVFGILPALQGSRVDLQNVFRGERGTPAASRLRAALVAGEIALGVLLVVGAGLMLKSLFTLARVDAGLVARDVLTFGVSLPAADYAEPQEQAAFYERVAADLGGLAPVASVGAVWGLPMTGFRFSSSFDIEGDPQEREAGEINVADPGFFATLRIPVLAGRGFEATDRAGAPRVLLASAAAARRFFPDGDAIGRRLRFHARPNRNVRFEGEIVGIVGDVRSDGLDRDVRALFYVPLAQAGVDSADLVVRAQEGHQPLALADAARAAVRRLDPQVPIADLQPLERVVAASIGDSRLYGLLLALFAAVALLLAAVGIYGVTAYVVAGRRREMGVRAALGATRAAIVGLVLRGAAGPAAAGLACGLVASFAFTRLLRGVLHGVDPLDPWVLAAALAILAAVALSAAALPARRAARLDAALALREEG